MRFFRPYKGDAYGAEPLWGHRLLLVGESHYDEPPHPACTADATIEIVTDHVVRGHVPFLSYVEQVALGFRRTVDRQQFWSRVCFVNFIQRAMPDSSHRPSDIDWAGGAIPLWQTVAECDPTAMLFFSRAAWNAIPGVLPDGDRAKSGPLCESRWIWRYARIGEPPVYAACFNHRSARSNPPVDIWKAWADHVWRVLEDDR